MRFIAASVLALVGLATASPVLNIEERANGPTEQMKFVSVKASGSGCPNKESFQVDMLDNNSTLHLTYSELQAATGDNTKIRDNRRFCQHSIKLFVPQGWRFSVVTATYRGYVSLPKGVESSLTSKYYFSGFQETATLQHNFKGAINKDYQETDTIGVKSVVWSPCGIETMLQMNNAVAIKPTGSKEPALMTVDSNDLKIEQKFHFKWEKCSK